MTPPPPPPGRRRLRDLAAGVDGRDLGRLFDRDALDAVEAITGERPRPVEKGSDLGDLLRLGRDFLVGLAFKLSPARRVLFVVALALPLLGMLSLDTTFGSTRVIVDFSPFFFAVSTLLLVLLLALELVDRLRVRDELELARDLQGQLLPRETPLVGGWRIAHSYRTANEIGGDYYAFRPLPDGRLAIAVGDASGHGMGAGLLMAVAHATLATAIDLDPRPAAVLAMLDQVLWRTGGRRAFMTLFYGVLDPATGVLDHGNAGHPFPVVRRADGTREEVAGGALPLGVSRRAAFAYGTLHLAPGDLVVLYSDGLPEALGGDDASAEAFGFERLATLLARPGDAAAVHDRLLAALDRHRGDRPLADDLTLVVLAYVGALPGSGLPASTSAATSATIPPPVAVGG